jgi:hypothetical protein
MLEAQQDLTNSKMQRGDNVYTPCINTPKQTAVLKGLLRSEMFL